MNGIRQDAFTTFLAPYLTDPRLTVMTDALVTRLAFDRGKTIDRVLIDAGGHVGDRCGRLILGHG